MTYFTMFRNTKVVSILKVFRARVKKNNKKMLKYFILITKPKTFFEQIFLSKEFDFFLTLLC